MKNTSTIQTGGIEGVVTARSCDCCGHHEMGIVTFAGDYIPFKPGMQVRIVEPTSERTGDETK